MGIIEKQATKIMIYSYLGVGLGFLNILLSVHILSTDEVGLTRILIALSTFFAHFGSLGFNAVTLKFFPIFKNKENGHHGFLLYGLLATLLGFIICVIGFFLFKDYIITSNSSKSNLFSLYSYYVLPLTLFILFFNFFDVYLRGSYNSTIGASSKDLTQRISILICLSLFHFNYINFNHFILFYCLSISLPTLILLYYIIKNGEWHVTPLKGFVKKALRNEMVKVAAYALISGSGGLLMANIDIFMINKYLGLGQTGIYGISFYFGTLIITPARSIGRIATSIIADAFKENNLNEIESVYKKSCNTQLAIGLLFFIGVYSNINNIMLLLPEEYTDGQTVILLISLGYLIDMATGLNTAIILTSKHYRYDGYFLILILSLAIIGNYVLIPLYGITGAAVATALNIAIYNLLRWIFLYYKYNMQPYNLNSAKLIAIGVTTGLLGHLIPVAQNFIFDIIIRSSVVCGTFIFLLLKLEASPEINIKIRKNLKHLPFFKP